MATLRAGEPAYFDSFCGLVPVIMQEITFTPAESANGRSFRLMRGNISSEYRARATVTKKHGPYQVGEEIESHAWDFAPLGSVHWRKGTILAYGVQVSHVVS